MSGSTASGTAAAEPHLDALDAHLLALQIEVWIAPACERVQVVGSVRRGKPVVGDLELVVIPRRTTDLFGAPVGSELDSLLEGLVADGRLRRHPTKPAYGERLKRFLLHEPWNVQVELWSADRDNWGDIVTIRTGSSAFSRLLMTAREHGGLMPAGMRQSGGYLWRGSERLSCPEECDYFGALGIDQVPDPETRDEALIEALRGKVV